VLFLESFETTDKHEHFNKSKKDVGNIMLIVHIKNSGQKMDRYEDSHSDDADNFHLDYLSFFVSVL
jgi:hypothetical protein